MRASLQTGGVPVVLKYSPSARAAPSSTCSATSRRASRSASVFFLSVLHALHDSFRKHALASCSSSASPRSPTSSTRERSFKAVNDAISKDAGVADVSGYTDYGRVWREFLQSWRTTCTRARR